MIIFASTGTGQVSDTDQYNHYFRMIYKDDVSDEVKQYMKLATLENKKTIRGSIAAFFIILPGMQRLFVFCLLTV